MRNYFRVILVALGLAIISAGIAGWILWHNEGVQLYSVQNNSMSPAMVRGDLIINVKINSGVKVGDIVSYQNGAGQTITSRIAHIDRQRGTIATRADTQSQAEAVMPISAVGGRTVSILPILGYVFELLRRPMILINLIYLPALLIALVQIKRLSRHYGYHPYKYRSPRYL